jgi:hypothetical protein
MQDLNNLLSSAGAKGWLVFNAEGINDRVKSFVTP